MLRYLAAFLLLGYWVLRGFSRDEVRFGSCAQWGWGPDRSFPHNQACQPHIPTLRSRLGVHGRGLRTVSAKGALGAQG